MAAADFVGLPRHSTSCECLGRLTREQRYESLQELRGGSYGEEVPHLWHSAQQPWLVNRLSVHGVLRQSLCRLRHRGETVFHWSVLSLLTWVNEPHPTLSRCWFMDFSHEVEVLDWTPGQQRWPEGTRLIGDKLVKTDSWTLNIIQHMDPLSRTAVSMVQSKDRPRTDRDYHRKLGHRLGTWGGSQELSVNKSLANATRLMNGEYPKDRKAVMRLLAEAKRGDERRSDETGCRFMGPTTQPRTTAWRKGSRKARRIKAWKRDMVSRNRG